MRSHRERQLKNGSMAASTVAKATNAKPKACPEIKVLHTKNDR
jgi:hypothetical protein